MSETPFVVGERVQRIFAGAEGTILAGPLADIYELVPGQLSRRILIGPVYLVRWSPANYPAAQLVEATVLRRPERWVRCEGEHHWVETPDRSGYWERREDG